MVERVTVAVQLRSDESAVRRLALAEHHGCGAVSEDHGQASVPVGALVGLRRDFALGFRTDQIPVGPRHEACVNVRAHQQDRPRGPGLDQAVGQLQSVWDGCALLPDVECRDARESELRPEKRA